MEETCMARHLVLVGGGHAHLTALKHLSEFIKKGHQVTLISSSPYHYYSGMGPGMLSAIYSPQEARFNIRKMAEDRGGAFIESRAVKIDSGNQRLLLDSGESVRYDVASFNTGSDVPMDAFAGSNGDIIPVKPVSNLYKAGCSILSETHNKSLRAVIIGGGPAGVEITANVWRFMHDHSMTARITLVAGKRLLGDAPSRVRQLAMGSLAKRNIKIIEGVKVQSVEGKKTILSDGSSLPFDYAFAAVGVRPSRLFRDSGLPTGEDGSMLVNEHLQSVAHPELLGGGDCISMASRKIARVGVYAVRQNPILYHNMMAALNESEMKTFIPGGSYMLIMNMGDGKGILWKDNNLIGKPPAWPGRLPEV
jgi:NADH dehydrogenase FAD-containing subunit